MRTYPWGRVEMSWARVASMAKSRERFSMVRLAVPVVKRRGREWRCRRRELLNL